ncbi:MAG: DUF6544 family protein [Bacillota bacterium]
MLKKIFIIVLFIVISFSIYTVFVNIYSNYQYEQDISTLKREYSLSDNFSIKNPSSIAIPAPMRRYIQNSIPTNRNLSTHVRINYSGKYRQQKYGEMYDFKVKSAYNLRTEEFVSEWIIEENEVIFNKLREVLLGEKKVYEFKKMGVKNQKSLYGEQAELFLKSRMMIDAVYFPYYYLGSSNISLSVMSGNRTLVKLNRGSHIIDFIFEFNEDRTLNSISSSKFTFGEDRVALKAIYENYIDINNFKVPASIIVEIENNFDEYILYEAKLDNINYQ